MKLIPDESVQGLQRIVITAVWGLGTLLLGTLVIAAIGLLLGVSRLTPLGIGGGLVVLVLAGVVALIVWRRQTPSDGSRQSSWTDMVGRNKIAPDSPPSATPSKVASTRIPKSTAKPTSSTPRVEAGSSAAKYKGQFNRELEAGNFDAAERIVTQMESLPGEDQWCANARRRLQFKRARQS